MSSDRRDQNRGNNNPGNSGSQERKPEGATDPAAPAAAATSNANPSQSAASSPAPASRSVAGVRRKTWPQVHRVLISGSKNIQTLDLANGIGVQLSPIGEQGNLLTTVIFDATSGSTRDYIEDSYIRPGFVKSIAIPTVYGESMGRMAVLHNDRIERLRNTELAERLNEVRARELFKGLFESSITVSQR